MLADITFRNYDRLNDVAIQVRHGKKKHEEIWVLMVLMMFLYRGKHGHIQLFCDDFQHLKSHQHQKTCYEESKSGSSTVLKTYRVRANPGRYHRHGSPMMVLQSPGHDAQQHLQTTGHVPCRQDPLRKHTHGTSPATLGW